jgi:segregation and condensation protein B
MLLKKIIAALLFAADHPLTARQIQDLFEDSAIPALKDIELACQTLQHDYECQAIELKIVATGYRFQVRAEFSPWITRLFAEKPPKYSKALLETLAIIVYHQPVTRADIETIRGVSVSSHIINSLLEREWIKKIGHKAVLGHPTLYATDQALLDYFNLSSLAQLPRLTQIKEWDETTTQANTFLKDHCE